MNRLRDRLQLILLCCIIIFLILLYIFRFCCSVSKDNSFTLLIYMTGSDLESADGAASADIAEILAASPGEDLHVLIQTGGTADWRLKEIGSGDCPKRFIAEGNELRHLETLDPCPMSSPETLHDFLSWGIETAPAARYAAILWNHGGGAILGYGFDELYPGTSMSLAGLRDAFEGLEARFSFIGFDACLMGCLETARALSGYADYLIASEGREPLSGWFYTDWIRMLEENPSTDILRLGSRIIRDFVSERNAGPYEPCTLSMVRLDQIPLLCENLGAWMEHAAGPSASFFSHAGIRSRLKDVGPGAYDQADLISFLEHAAGAGFTEGTASLIADVRDAVVLSEHNRTAGTPCGLSFYYPFLYPDQYDRTAGSLKAAGFPSDYFQYFDSFLSRLEKERAESLPDDEFTGVRILADGSIDPASADGAGLVSSLGFKQLCISGKGYVYAGKYDPDSDGNCSLYDAGRGYYLEIGGRLVSYEPASEYDDGRTGYVNAILNGSRYIRLRLISDPGYSDVNIAGYLEVTDSVVTGHEDTLVPPVRGLRKLQPGDRLQFCFDHYRIIRHRPVFDGVVTLDAPIVCGGRLSASRCKDPETYLSPAGTVTTREGFVYLEESSALPVFQITDIYGRETFIRAIDAWDPEVVIRIAPNEKAGAPEAPFASDAPADNSAVRQSSYSLLLPPGHVY